MLKIYGCSDDNLEFEGCINDEMGFYEGDGIIKTSCGAIIHYWWNDKSGWNSEILKQGINKVTMIPVPDKDDFVPLIEIDGDVEWITIEDENEEVTRFFKGENYKETDAELELKEFIEGYEDIEEDQAASIAFMARMIFTGENSK